MIIGSSLTSAQAFGSSAGEEYPQAAYNPARNEFTATFSKTTDFLTYTPLLRVYGTDGAQIGSDIVLGAAEAGYLGEGPATAHDRGNSRMMVAWVQNTKVRASLVDLTNNALMVTKLELGTVTTTYGAGVAFSPARQKYLIVWNDGTGTLVGRYLTATGALSGAQFNVMTGVSSRYNLRVRYVSSTDAFMIGYDESNSYYIKNWTVTPPAAASAPAFIASGYNGYPDFFYDEKADRVFFLANFSGAVKRQTLTSALATSGSLTTVATGASTPSWADIEGGNDASDKVVAVYQTTALAPITLGAFSLSSTGAATNLGVVGTAPNLSGYVIGWDIAYNYYCNRTLTLYSFDDYSWITLHAEVAGDPCQTQLTSNPAALNFGKVDVTQPAIQSVGVKPFLGSLTIDSIELAGPDHASFVLKPHNCLGNVAENEVCPIEVIPAPGATGLRRALISIKSNAIVNPVLDIPVEMDAVGAVATITKYQPTHQSGGHDPAEVTAIWNAIPGDGLRYRAYVCTRSDFKDCDFQSSAFSGQ